ncbi:ABC transporter permease [Streptosporangium sp. NPDC049644]|uniref:ABC transporter permease n=1 Tax=Streptosporangium sp. NPDC049644 TaxID=3155507 RepID=UPI0034299667
MPSAHPPERSSKEVTITAKKPTVRHESILGIVIPLSALVLWQLLASLGLLEDFLPAPVRVGQALVDLVSDGRLADALLISLLRAVTGLVLGVAIGSALGWFCGTSLLGSALLNPTLQALRALPVLALVPLFILWFGIGELSKILMIAIATMFPIYVNVMSAVSNVDRKYLELASTLKLSRWQVLRRIHLPAALPAWFVGFRYSSGFALVILVISEQVNADSGLGYLMTEARTYYRLDVIIVGILIYGILGVLADRGVAALERRALRWNDAVVKA